MLFGNRACSDGRAGGFPKKPVGTEPCSSSKEILTKPRHKLAILDFPGGRLFLFSGVNHRKLHRQPWGGCAPQAWDSANHAPTVFWSDGVMILQLYFLLRNSPPNTCLSTLLNATLEGMGERQLCCFKSVQTRGTWVFQEAFSSCCS